MKLCILLINKLIQPTTKQFYVERNICKMKRNFVNKSISICLSLAIVALFSSRIVAQNSVPDPNFHIYLAFGQSNMEGWSSNGNTQIESQDRDVSERFQSVCFH